MSAVAVIVILSSFDREAVTALHNLFAEAEACGAPIAVVPIGSADVALLRECCAGRSAIVECAGALPSFGGAANAGAHGVSADVLVFVYGANAFSTGFLRVLIDGYRESQAGVMGPRIVTNGGANDETGIVVAAAQNARGFELQRLAGARMRLECDALPNDCLVTSRARFDDAGGFDETFDAAFASIDFCLRVAERGGRIMVEPATAYARAGITTHAQPRPEDEAAFNERWRERVETHENFWPEYSGSILRTEHFRGGLRIERVPVPKVAIMLYGPQPAPELIARLSGSRMKPAAATWADADAAVRTARKLTEVRGPDYVAFVRTDTVLAGDWLNELVNAFERDPDTAAAIVAEPADARCVLVAPRRFPQHLRIEPHGSFDASVAAWLRAATDTGRTIARVRRTATITGPAAPDVHDAVPVAAAPAEPFASIVMLSWNAPDYTEMAIASIRAHTSTMHEIIIVDNGSGPDTLARLRAIAGIRVIYNAVNTGFAFACNQGIAAAAGTHIVLLNNDVLVTDGWLEALIAVERAHPTIGCSAPRSNEIAGQQRLEVPYTDVADLPAFAAQRAAAYRGRWTHQSRVIGMCMCLPRVVIEEIGGLDTRYGTGNFEDDDYSMRIRAAGYDIAVCDDSFVHHFGSVTFKANAVNYDATFERNMNLFKQRWNVTFVSGGYDGWLPAQRGFVRERDYVALPEPVGVGADWTPSRG